MANDAKPLTDELFPPYIVMAGGKNVDLNARARKIVAERDATIDKLKAENEALRGRPGCWHFTASPGVVWCGADYRNMNSTELVWNATCRLCLIAANRALQSDLAAANERLNKARSMTDAVIGKLWLSKCRCIPGSYDCDLHHALRQLLAQLEAPRSGATEEER